MTNPVLARQRLRRFLPALTVAVLAIARSDTAWAADEEIQVYLDEMNAPGEPGLDLHLNTVTAGDRSLDYPGQEPSLRRWRLTPEFSYGLSRTVELGLYLPLATLASDGRLRAEGIKGRIKWLAPHGEEGLYGGANIEIGRVAYSLDQNSWNGELKMIGGWRRGRWLAGVNANLDFAIAGPVKGPATLDIATRLGYRMRPGLTLGVESYTGMGPLRELGHLQSNDHSTFATLDIAIGRWDLQFGVGKGYGANRDRTILKAIIGVPIGR